MLTIHHLGLSQSERIVWLLEELELAYELRRYPRDPTTKLAPTEYKALHPFGTAPVLDDGDLRLAESGAIIEYIIHTHGNGRLTVAPGAAGYADYLFWWHFANASMVPAAITNGLASRLGGSDNPVMSSLSERLNLAYQMVEKRLGEASYFAGDRFTAADIMMFFPLTTMRSFSGRGITDYPNLSTYLQLIGERPAYQAAMTKAEPGMAPLLS